MVKTKITVSVEKPVVDNAKLGLMKVAVSQGAVFLLNVPFDQYTGIKIDVRYVHFAFP